MSVCHLSVSPDLHREARRFVGVGVTTVAVDALVCVGLTATAAAFDGGVVSVVVAAAAKAVSFTTGAIFAYWANRIYTFQAPQQGAAGAVRFGALYGATLAANVAVYAGLTVAGEALAPFVGLSAGPGGEFAHVGAFLGATAVSAALNFVGMRRFVFRRGLGGKT